MRHVRHGARFFYTAHRNFDCAPRWRTIFSTGAQKIGVCAIFFSLNFYLVDCIVDWSMCSYMVNSDVWSVAAHIGQHIGQ